MICTYCQRLLVYLLYFSYCEIYALIFSYYEILLETEPNFRRQWPVLQSSGILSPPIIPPCLYPCACSAKPKMQIENSDTVSISEFPGVSVLIYCYKLRLPARRIQGGYPFHYGRLPATGPAMGAPLRFMPYISVSKMIFSPSGVSKYSSGSKAMPRVSVLIICVFGR